MRREWLYGVLVAVAGVLAPIEVRAAPPLQLPWTCGDSYPVTNGHQTNTHTGMDAWAWDFGLPVGTDVVAPADGVVRLIKMNSNQGGCNSAYANDANYVVIEFGDGTEALLMHLQHHSSNLSVGQSVKQGDVVGRVGLTGWACGAHLHFQIQKTCNSWWCQSQPAQFVGVGDPGAGPALESENCPSAEPCELALDGTSITIDDAHPSCFDRITSWFWPGADGIEDAHVYTWTNDAPEPDTIGVWSFGVTVPGDYRLEVFVPDSDASSQMATYDVQTGTQIVALGPLDQSSATGWVDLGVVTFEAGDEHWVRLRDNTGEDRALDRKLAFDAIRLTFEPVDASSDDGDAAGDAGDDDTGGHAPDPGDPSDPGDTSDTGADSSDPGATDGGALPHPALDGDEGGGCRAGAPRPVRIGLALLVLVPALVRRRRG